MLQRYHISVPATSANLGPGYDRLGLALDIRLSVTAEPTEEWFVEISGEGSHLLDTCEFNLIAQACRRACENHGWSPQPMRVIADNPIPISRGLGSSAAAIVTGMALAHLANTGNIEKDILFHESAEMEGHPDNVAAAIYGGLLEIIRTADTQVASQREIAKTVKVLLVIPTQMKSTAELRKVVPDTLPSELQQKTDTALLNVLQGLAQGDPTLLHFSEQDYRHQPYRLAKQPVSKLIFELLQQTPGISGAFLSGAGSTVAGWVVGELDPTSTVNQRLSAQNVPASVLLVDPDHQGVLGGISYE